MAVILYPERITPAMISAKQTLQHFRAIPFSSFFDAMVPFQFNQEHHNFSLGSFCPNGLFPFAATHLIPRASRLSELNWPGWKNSESASVSGLYLNGFPSQDFAHRWRKRVDYWRTSFHIIPCIGFTTKVSSPKIWANFWTSETIWPIKFTSMPRDLYISTRRVP